MIDRPSRATAFSRNLLSSGVIGLCAALVLPAAFIDVNKSYLLLTALAAAAAALVIVLQPRADQRMSAVLFVWALFLRVLAVTVTYALAVRAGGPFLGPDSTKYFSGGLDLAGRAFMLDEIPVVHFGSFDIGQYYLFAAAIRFTGADLFGLQVMNCALLALIVPMAYDAVRTALPGAALPVAALAAFGPSLIALSSIDLLKDPSVLCATIAAIWVVIRLTSEDRPVALAAYTLVGIAAALYLRTARFYSFAYLEFAFLAAIVLASSLGRVRVFRQTRAFVLACAVFAAGEVIPARLYWPPSPLMVIDTVVYTLGTPSLRQYASSLFDRIKVTGDSERAPSEPASGGLTGLLGIPVNLVRRLYGPFAWILPARWDFRTFQDGQYYLYPGMLVWYALLPAVALGMAIEGWRIFKGSEKRFGLIFLWLFTALYFAQYCLINLSYRQRDVMLPLVAVFAFIGMQWALTMDAWKRWYAGYWALLGGTAAAHLAVRAWLLH